MPKRPWITPEELKQYTELELVKNRADRRLEIDITRAELKVISYTNNDFRDAPDEVMADVRIATLLIAEAIAFNSAKLALEYTDPSTGKPVAGKIKSESFDDYNYTLADGDAGITVESLDLGPLLDPYVIPKETGTTTMRISAI